MNKIVDLNELGEILNLNPYTLRNYLGNYRFNKYITKIQEGNKPRIAFFFTKEFAKDLAEYLYLKNKWGAIKLIGDYFCIDFFKIIESEDDLYA